MSMVDFLSRGPPTGYTCGFYGVPEFRELWWICGICLAIVFLDSAMWQWWGERRRIYLPAAAVLASSRQAAANQRGGAVGVIVDSENVAFGRSIDNCTFSVFLLRGLLSLLHKWQTSAKATFEKPFKHLTATAMASSELVTFTTRILRWTRISMTMKWYCAASLSFASFFLFVLWTLTMLSGGRTYKNGRQRRWWPGQLRGVPQNGPWFQQEICRQLNCTIVSQLIALLMRWTPPLPQCCFQSPLRIIYLLLIRHDNHLSKFSLDSCSFYFQVTVIDCLLDFRCSFVFFDGGIVFSFGKFCHFRSAFVIEISASL